MSDYECVCVLVSVMCVCVLLSVMCVCVCLVCVHMWREGGGCEGEKGREDRDNKQVVWVCVRETDRAIEIQRQRQRECVCVCERERERERESKDILGDKSC